MSFVVVCLLRKCLQKYILCMFCFFQVQMNGEIFIKPHVVFILFYFTRLLFAAIGL
jgi:hypothetical protein